MARTEKGPDRYSVLLPTGADAPQTGEATATSGDGGVSSAWPTGYSYASGFADDATSGGLFSRWRLRDWRLRTKLLAVLLVPSIAALVLGGLQVQRDFDNADQLVRTSDQVRLDTTAAKLTQELERERDLTVAYIAANRNGDLTALQQQRGKVDAAANDFRAEIADVRGSSFPDVADPFDNAASHLNRLASLRDVAQSTTFPPDAAQRAFTDSIDTLIALGEQGIATISDPQLIRQYLASNAMTRAKEQESIKSGLLSQALLRGVLDPNSQRQLLSADAQLDSALSDFRKWANPAEVQSYDDTVTGPDVDAAHTIQETALVHSETGRPLSDLNQQQWDAVSTQTVNLTGKVDDQLRAQLQSAVDRLASRAKYQTTIEAGLVALVLILAFVIALLIARSMLRPLRTLRRSALDVADWRLPDAVNTILADPNPDVAEQVRVEPLPIYTKEEIGRVARSFDAVHSQALRLASEQALLRNNVNDLFVNLARRSQTLVQRQLSLIDRLEQDEQDPDQLSSLFELDHLATRMRRNNENLLILGGADLTRRVMRPVPLAEVVGAAVSEVEQYRRVTVEDSPELAIQGRIVNDLVHLLAELLENATVFSNPDTEVTVRTLYRRGELVMEIRDRGVGIDRSEIVGINERLSRPPEVDVSVSRRMGLFVVGQLAQRHNIRVHLANNEDNEGGVTAIARLDGEYVSQLTPDGPMPMPDTQSISGIGGIGGENGDRAGGSVSESGTHLGLAAAFGSRDPATNGATTNGAAIEPPTAYTAFGDASSERSTYGASDEMSTQYTAMPGFEQTEYAEDGYAQDGYAQDGYARDGYARDGYVQDEFAQDEYAQHGQDDGSGEPPYSVRITSSDTDHGASDVPRWDPHAASAADDVPAMQWPSEEVSAASADSPDSETTIAAEGAASNFGGPGALFRSTFQGDPAEQEGPAGQAGPASQWGQPSAVTSDSLSAGTAHDMDDAPTQRLPIYEAVLSQWFRESDVDFAAGSSADPSLESSGQGFGIAPADDHGPGGNGAGSFHAGALSGRGSANGDSPAERVAADDHRDDAESESPAEPQVGEDTGARDYGQFGPAHDPGWGSADAGWEAAEALVEHTRQPQQMTSAGLPKRVPKTNLVPGSAAPKSQSGPPSRPTPPRSADAVRGRMSSFQQGVRRGRHARVEDAVSDPRSNPSRPEEQE